MILQLIEKIGIFFIPFNSDIPKFLGFLGEYSADSSPYFFMVSLLLLMIYQLLKGKIFIPFKTVEYQIFLCFILVLFIATIFNIFYPISNERDLNKHVKSIDHLVADHLFMLSLLVKDPEYTEEYYRHYTYVDHKIKEFIDIVELVDKDLLFQNDHSYLAYFHMRKEQTNYIRHMYMQAIKINKIHPYALDISKYIVELSGDIGHYNKAADQLRQLEAIQQAFKSTELPKTREEFEIRAKLYQILIEIESLLTVKIEFHHQFPEFGIKHFKY